MSFVTTKKDQQPITKQKYNHPLDTIFLITVIPVVAMFTIEIKENDSYKVHDLSI